MEVAERKAEKDRKAREALWAGIEDLVRGPTVGTIGMVKTSPIGNNPLPPAAMSILAEAARIVGATLDPPETSPPEDSIHAPLTREEKQSLGSSVRGS
jgi:hypothetical protein